ncbi:MAG: LPXTG cell wall anchor domain-containing protein [Micrococcales bacterium]
MSRNEMLTRSSRRFLATALVAGSAFLPFAATPALAAGCPTGSTLVSGTTCQAVFTTDSTFTMPTGVTAIEALLVGAGGGGTMTYGGGGGEVKIVTLATSGNVTFTIGTGGAGASGTATDLQQGLVLESANGGLAPSGAVGGASGSGNTATNYGGAGAGAGSSTFVGGAGVIVSSLTSTLFTSVSTCYGGGGAGVDWAGGVTVAGCGGGYASAYVSNTGGGPFNANTGSATMVAPVANSGGGGTPQYTFNNTARFSTVDGAGANGKVVIRYTLTPEAFASYSGELAETGASSNSSLIAVGTALGLAGIGLLATSRRRSRNSK